MDLIFIFLVIPLEIGLSLPQKKTTHFQQNLEVTFMLTKSTSKLSNQSSLCKPSFPPLGFPRPRHLLSTNLRHQSSSDITNSAPGSTSQRDAGFPGLQPGEGGDMDWFP